MSVNETSPETRIAVPIVTVYVWARSLARKGWALAAAALTAALPAFVYTGLVMTEVAFFPLAVLAAWAMARALARPAVANQMLAVAGCVLADAALDGRLQPGKLVLMTGMGAGLTWGSALLRWTAPTEVFV